MKKWSKYNTLFWLYFSQGLPFGFFAHYLPLEMRSQAWSAQKISFWTVVLGFPWACKFLWSPLVDTFYWPHLGRRRSWILPLNTLLILLLLMTTFTSPSQHIYALILLLFLVNLVTATQDIAVDGWAVSLLTAEDRGIGNGIQVVGYKLGMLVASTGIIAIMNQYGWKYSQLSMATLLVPMLVVAFFMRESDSKAIPETFQKEESASVALKKLMKHPGIWLLLIFIGSYKVGESMAGSKYNLMLYDKGLILNIPWQDAFEAEFNQNQLRGQIEGTLHQKFLERKFQPLPKIFEIRSLEGKEKCWLVLNTSPKLRIEKIKKEEDVHQLRIAQQGFSKGDIAALMGTYGMIGSLLGSLLGGLMMRYCSRFWALLVFMLGQGFFILWIALIASWETIPLDLIRYVLTGEHFIGGMATTALFAFMMDFADPEWGGSQYTLFATVEVALKIAGWQLSAYLMEGYFGTPEHPDYVSMYLASFAILLLPLGLLIHLRNTEIYKRFVP